MGSVYAVNKGINTSIEFKGVKAQYISYLAVGTLILLMLFVVGYLVHLSYFILLPSLLIIGVGLYMYVTRLSDKYGEHGLMKAGSYRALPKVIVSRGRSQFLLLASERDSK